MLIKSTVSQTATIEQSIIQHRHMLLSAINLVSQQDMKVLMRTENLKQILYTCLL